jgi:hypothetical protein
MQEAFWGSVFFLFAKNGKELLFFGKIIDFFGKHDTMVLKRKGGLVDVGQC